MIRVSIVSAALGLASFLLASCGGGDDELTEAIQDLPRAKLETMVLPAEEVGSLVDGFEVDTDSGVTDNEEAADDSMDPDDDADDFDDAGRITGYSLSYSEPNIGSILEAGEGVLSVASEVELFDSADGADADIDRKLDQLDEFEGSDLDGAVLEGHEEFDVDGIGDRSGGVEFSASLTGTELTSYATVVYFRIDRLEASVFIVALDDQDLREEAEEAAKALEERIRGVALEEIDEDPVEIPSDQIGDDPDAEPTQVAAPPGVPELAAVALQLSDLPDGFEIEEEGYDPLPDREFTREFGAGDQLSIEIGGTEVVGIQNTISLFDSLAEARLSVAGFERLLTSEEGRDLFAQSFAQGSGGLEADVSDIQSSELQVGDQSVAILGVVDTAAGSFVFTFMVARVDTTVVLVNVTALSGNFTLADVVPLLRLEAERVASIPGS